MSNYFIIVSLLFIGLVNGYPVAEDEVSLNIEQVAEIDEWWYWGLR